jgi:uncharacterized protein (TIGR03435 family)
MRAKFCLFALAAAALVAAQPQLPGFEVASVKLVADGRLMGSPARNGRRINWDAGLSTLVRYAFHLPSWRVVGLDSSGDRFAIDATTETTTTEDQLRQMFQRLLIERFQLAYHWDTKELSGFALVRGKGEPKIRAVPDDAPPAALPDYFAGKESMIPGIEGRTLVTVEGKGIAAVTARRVTLAQVCDALQDPLGAFVHDKTGLPGKFYFAFKFAREDSSADPDAPSVYAAVQEQLGLKFEKEKGPVQILVIDRLDRLPSSN